MEGIEEPILQKAPEECVKDTSIEVTMDVETLEKQDVDHTSNGVTELNVASAANAQEPQYEAPASDIPESDTQIESVNENNSNATENPTVAENTDLVQEVVQTEILAATHDDDLSKVKNNDENITIETVVIEESVEIDGIVENNTGNISFETEIFIENNTTELDESYEEPNSSNILSELGQDIELSDVLRSNDVSESVENNNCEQEVFNKEELLDILEGNDTEESRKVISENFIADSKKLEEHLAMQQLNRLKVSESKKKSKSSPKKPEKKQHKRTSSQSASKEKPDESASSQQVPKDLVEGSTDTNNITKETRSKTSTKETKTKATSPNTSKESNEKVIESNSQTTKESKKKANETTNSQSASKGIKRKVNEMSNSQNTLKEKPDEETVTVSHIISKENKRKSDEKDATCKSEKEAKCNAKESKTKKESIVNSLVQDWSDDDLIESDKSTVLDESQNLLDSTEKIVEVQNNSVNEDAETLNENESGTLNNSETSVNDDSNRKSLDESQPQRRLGRVIKKKVIYDPDNPDTFTKKSKIQVKKEKEVAPEKDTDQTTPKKIKTEQSPQVPKIKSPVSKMQWKKPQPKNNKQSNRRLTEIDKLLMDEGAVNMICQLTPEALKGNKNMKSKAEYIKNIQSNTPDTKEMKFRERKSKAKVEDGDTKKVGSSKQRLSLNSSIKSPAVSEDFENHSADDSIIYRRHSSSSYSSSCMSPRRLSDVDGGLSNQNAVITQIIVQELEPAEKSDTSIFMSGEKTSTPRQEIMNKSDCLSIKQKLNSKLSLALNKRKLSSLQADKPTKVKKVAAAVSEVSTDVTLKFNQKLAEICIRKKGSLFNVQIMKALENILLRVDLNKESTVTLITSESGTLCRGLDLKPIIGREKHAHDIADQARSLMLTLENHSKLILIGVEGKIQGFSLALAALGDVLLASENSSFSLAESSNSVIHPGAGVLSSKALSQEMLNDLIVFGREFSSTEALRGGLVSRVIWPERFQEQVRVIAMDIANQPSENIMLKKQLLNLKKTGSPSTFQAGLDKERDLFVNYWTSEEGLELVRASIHTA